MNKQQALDSKKVAVIGASARKEKYGNKIYRRLKANHYEVYAVNPGLTEIDGDKCYAALSELPVQVDFVNFVVPEAVGLATLEQMAELGIKTAWLQPGSDSAAVIAKAAELNIEIIQACILVELAAKNL